MKWLSMLVVGVLILAFSVGAKVVPVPDKGLGVAFGTEKPLYPSGEPMTMVLTVFNYSESEVTFVFTSTQRYDFLIQDQQGKEVWRWSKGKFFGEAVGEETLGPKRREVTYKEKCPAQLKPGTYKVIGLLADEQHSMSCTVTIKVRQ